MSLGSRVRLISASHDMHDRQVLTQHPGRDAFWARLLQFGFRVKRGLGLRVYLRV